MYIFFYVLLENLNFHEQFLSDKLIFSFWNCKIKSVTYIKISLKATVSDEAI